MYWNEPTLKQTIKIMEQWELITGKPVCLKMISGKIRPVFVETEEVVMIE